MSKLAIVVSGMIAADSRQGGATWAVLQYVLGLRELGHRVLFVEPIKPGSIQPSGAALADSINVRYFGEVVSEFGLQGDAALLLAGSRTTDGLSYERLSEFTREADLLINISGMLTDENLLSPIPVRAYLDLDPAFVQLWHAQGIDMRFAGHTHFVTIGCAIGEAGCPVPTCGVPWIKTLQPIVLSHWPVAERIRYDGLTTIANWRGYGSVEHEGVHYGQKVHSLRRFFDLPSRTPEKFLVALAIHPGEVADIAELDRFGWQRLDPAQVAGSPRSYQEFIQGSKAEFGIAKSGYVLSRCGWFSDRSVCYLASGRPVIAHDTGFQPYVPAGAGLFAFQTAEDVLAAIDAINGDYDKHRRAARDLAEEYFDSNKVLTRLLLRVGFG
jgi:hypothetical protein